TFKYVGRKCTTFKDTLLVVNELLNSRYELDESSTMLNSFSMVSEFSVHSSWLHCSLASIKAECYDSRSVYVRPYSLHDIIYHSSEESTTSEPSARITARNSLCKKSPGILHKSTQTSNHCKVVMIKELTEMNFG
ncbi:mCG1043294, partial [Mus musculus]